MKVSCEVCDEPLDPVEDWENVILLRDPWTNEVIGHAHHDCPVNARRSA